MDRAVAEANLVPAWNRTVLPSLNPISNALFHFRREQVIAFDIPMDE
jgi:hypothetical protein